MQRSDNTEPPLLVGVLPERSETCSSNQRAFQIDENRATSRPKSDEVNLKSKMKSRPLSFALLPVAFNGAPEYPSDHLLADVSSLRPSPQRTPSPLRRPASQPTIPTTKPNTSHNRDFHDNGGLESSKVDKFMADLAAREGNVLKLKQQINALKQELAGAESKLALAENDVESMRAKGGKIFKNFADRERNQAVRYLAAQQELSDQAARPNGVYHRNPTSVREKSPRSRGRSERPRHDFGESLVYLPSAGSRQPSPEYSRPKELRSSPSPTARQWRPAASAKVQEAGRNGFDHTSIEQATDELLDLGKKIIGGVGNQFLELFRDVKLATMGDESHTITTDPQTPRTMREALGPKALPASEHANSASRMRFIHTATGHISPGQLMPDTPSSDGNKSKYS